MRTPTAANRTEETLGGCMLGRRSKRTLGVSHNFGNTDPHPEMAYNKRRGT